MEGIKIKEMSDKLSKKLKEYQRYLKVTSGIDSDVEEMITDAEALEKLAEKLRTANYERQSKIEKLEDEVIQLNKFLNKKWN